MSSGRWPALVVTAVALFTAGHAHGQRQDDGSYRRLTHDTALQLDVGAGPCSGPASAALARLTVLHLQTAGVYVSGSHAFSDSSPSTLQALSLGTELRPLFLPRFLKDLEQGPAWVDLTIDSFALFLGAAIETGDDAHELPAFEAGASVGLPLAPRAHGPWVGVRALRRWQWSGHDDDHADFVAITLGWQLPLATGLVSRQALPAW